MLAGVMAVSTTIGIWLTMVAAVYLIERLSLETADFLLSMRSSMSDTVSNENVQKSLSLMDTTSIIVGIVIGAGIFKFPTLVAMNVNSGGMMLLAWFLGGIVTLIGALSYAELATTYPHQGGDYYYLQRAYGGSFSFLFAWTRMMVVQPGSIVLMAFIIGEELTRYAAIAGSLSPSIYAVIVVLLLTALNYAGIKEGKWAQKILTLAIYGGLLFLVVISFIAPEAGMEPVASKEMSASGFGLAMIFVLFTFGGWNESAYVSAEVKDSKKNIVRALLLGIGSITFIYLLINFALLQTLGLEEMAKFDAPQRLVERSLGSEYVSIISLILIIAALSTTNATIITGARSNYALGRDFGIFSFMNRWHEKNQTPTAALLFQAVISIALILLGSITKSGLQAMVDYTAPAFWFFFVMTGISLFVLRRKDRDMPRVFSVPLYPVIPGLFVLISLYMLQSSLAYTGWGAMVSVAVVVAGIIPLAVSRRFNKG